MAGELPGPIQVLHNLFEAGDLEDHFSYPRAGGQGSGPAHPYTRRITVGRASRAILLGELSPSGTHLDLARRTH